MGLTSFTVNEDINKEDQYKMMEEGVEDMIHETCKVEGALHTPNGMTKNS
jgi:hypothetical protein